MMETVQNDTFLYGKMNCFEVTESYLLPHYLIDRNQAVWVNRGAVYIYYISREAVSSMSETKPEIGNTGIELWFYTKED